MSLPNRYLQVTLDLPNDDHQTQMFEQYVGQLLPTFEAAPWPGWKLFLSAVRDESRDPAWCSPPSGGREVKTYLNVWRVRDYNSLPYLMEYFDDDEVYRHLDAMVVREVQDFTEELMFNPARQQPSFTVPKATSYLSMSLDMVKDPDRLEAFDTLMVKLASAASEFQTKYQMQLAHATYAQTGLLNRYFMIWGTSTLDFKGAMAWLQGQSDFAGALNPDFPDNLKWWVWEPKRYPACT